LCRGPDGNVEFFELDAITARIVALLSKGVAVRGIADILARETRSKVGYADILEVLSAMTSFIPLRFAATL